MTPATTVVLKLDLDHLTPDEKDWLHALLNRVQKRMIRKTITERKSNEK